MQICVLPFLAKIQNGRHFWGGEFLKIAKLHCLDTLCVENFAEIFYLARLRDRREILPFLAKIRKFKMAAIFGEGKIFGKLQRLHSLDPLWVENFAEIALSRTVKEIKQICVLPFLAKIRKSQNGGHFWGGEIFLKIANITFLRYPVGRKFRRNRSISHG